LALLIFAPDARLILSRGLDTLTHFPSLAACFDLQAAKKVNKSDVIQYYLIFFFCFCSLCFKGIKADNVRTEDRAALCTGWSALWLTLWVGGDSKKTTL